MEEVDVLKLMIKHYEERGGGYSQKEALKYGIECITRAEKKPTVERIMELLNEKYPCIHPSYPPCNCLEERYYLAKAIHQLYEKEE